MHYIVANRIFVKTSFKDDFELRFKNRAGQINQQPGLVRMELLQPQSEDTPYVVMTHWQDEQAFKTWLTSEDFKQSHKSPMPKEAFLEGGGLEKYLSIILSESNNV